MIAAVALVLAVVQQRTLTDMVSNWDVQHFGKLAADGYLAEADGTLMAFFPGWPVILSLFSQLGVPVAISGVIISTACSALAAAALYRLGGPWAAVAWLFAPTAVFTMVPYTESLFCALAFWAWERARADRWLAAALLTSLACTVRVSGLFLVGALLVMIITSDEPGEQSYAARADGDARSSDHGVRDLLVRADPRGDMACHDRQPNGAVRRNTAHQRCTSGSIASGTSSINSTAIAASSPKPSISVRSSAQGGPAAINAWSAGPGRAAATSSRSLAASRVHRALHALTVGPVRPSQPVTRCQQANATRTSVTSPRPLRLT